MDKWQKYIFVIAWSGSIILNMWQAVCLSSYPLERCGVLTRDVTVFLKNGSSIVLPQGLVVRDDSPQGLAAVGQFEKHRFSITATSDWELVNYDVKWQTIHRSGSLYHVGGRPGE